MITIHTEALNQGLSVHTRSLSLHSEPKIEKFHAGILGSLCKENFAWVLWVLQHLQF